MTMARNEQLIKEVDSVINDPRFIAMLDALSASEGTDLHGDNGYNVQFGGGIIQNLNKHPGTSVSYYSKQRNADGSRKKENSTAAGRYQFLASTWKDIADRLGLKDFSKDSQDRAALGLMLSIPGVKQAIMSGDIATAVKKLNGTWTSLPGSVEGGKRHGLRSFEYVLGAYNASALKHGLSPITAKWDDKEYSNIAAPRSSVGTAGQVQFKSPFEKYYNSYDGGVRGRSFLREALSGIYNRSYASAGDVPLEVTSNGTSSFSANPDITDPENVATLRQRLLAPNPNERYGLSFVGSGLRPTITRTDNVTGQDHSVIEMGKGVYVDAATGQRVNYDGSVYEGAPVEVPQAEYLAPGETSVETPEVIVADPATELQANAVPLTETALVGNTPLTAMADTVSVSVPRYATPAQQVEVLVNALGGDAVTRQVNSLNNPLGLSKELIRRAGSPNPYRVLA